MNIDISLQQKILNEEIEKLPSIFFSELNFLLNCNKKNAISINAINFDYIISRTKENEITIEKKNLTSSYKLNFSLEEKRILQFNIEDVSNKYSVSDYNGGLYFIYEIYNLFLHRRYSYTLEKLNNSLTEKSTDHLYFSTHDENIFYEIEKTGKNILVILRITFEGKILEKLAVIKTDEIPLWFIISKTPDETCIHKVDRLFRLFGDLPQNYCNFFNLTGMLNYKYYKSEYDPYEDFSKVTQEENLLLDFEKKHIKSYFELPKPEPEIHCPSCGKIMRLTSGRYGQFYSCTNYPDCKGTLSIKKTKQI